MNYKKGEQHLGLNKINKLIIIIAGLFLISILVLFIFKGNFRDGNVTAINNTVAENTFANNTTEDEVISDTTDADNTVTKNTAPDTSVAKKSAPDTTVTKKSAPDTTTAKNTASDTSVKKNTASDTPVKKNTSSDTPVTKSAAANNTAVDKNDSGSKELKINISELSETVKFYPYTVEDTKMEVMALKASDGSIRTAFNTCQVCFDSGRGYYKQDEDVLVCQNCGNRFQIDQVEQVRGGCNPVPIGKENKIDDGKTITISYDYLKSNKDLFANWKTR